MLETVAAVPPMVGGMTHHLSSLSKMRQDNWIKALLDEAENERMHLMTFIQITKPSFFDRMLILAVQGVVWNLYFICYLISPRTCHRFVGYLEEEAVKTYTKFLKMIDAGKIANVPAPKIAKDYWGLPEDASLRDVVLVIRADEMDHRDVNHTVSDTLLRLNNDQYPGEGEININPSQLYSMDEAIKQSGNTPLKERQ
jgi:ubiquinol oxidase